MDKNWAVGNTFVVGKGFIYSETEEHIEIIEPKSADK